MGYFRIVSDLPTEKIVGDYVEADLFVVDFPIRAVEADDFSIEPVELSIDDAKKAKTAQRCPERFAARLHDLCGYHEPVEPVTDPVRQARRVSFALASGVHDADTAVRGLSLPPHLAHAVLGIPLDECEAVVSFGLHRPDDMGAQLDAAAHAQEHADQAARDRAAAQEKYAAELVTIKPSDYGRAAIVANNGALVTGPVEQFAMGFKTGLLGVAVAAKEMFRGQVTKESRLAKEKLVLADAPDLTWPDVDLENLGSPGFRLLASDATVQVRRDQLPPKSNGQFNAIFWDTILRSLDCDRSAMSAPGEGADLSSDEGERAAPVIERFMQTHPKTDFNIERAAREFGDVSAALLVTLACRAGWIVKQGEPKFAGIHAAAPGFYEAEYERQRDALRAQFERYRACGDRIGKGTYPDAAPEPADVSAWDLAVAELLQTNDAPTSADAKAYCESRGLIAANSHQLIGAALTRTGRKVRKVQGVRRWVKA